MKPYHNHKRREFARARDVRCQSHAGQRVIQMLLDPKAALTATCDLAETTYIVAAPTHSAGVEAHV